MAAWALLALAPVAAGAILSFASYYGDHMVLQKEPVGAVVWGYGEPGAAVTVALSDDGGLVLMKKMARVKEPSGTWTTILDPMDQGGPYTLTARQGSKNVTLRDIYFGDVWLCSGQSNMVMTVLQLSTYRRQSPQDSFARLRWHQTADVGVVPNARIPRTFMAVAMDLCDEHSPYGSIHPRDKQNVAHRLQLGARAVVYGEKNLVFQGPFPTQAVLEVTRALLNVTYSQRLVWRRRDTPAFEVCCSSPVSLCRWLPAPMVAVRSHTVTLALGGCGTLVLALRYAWAEWPCEYQSCALYNTQGLPAPPFLLETLRSSSRAGEMELLLLHPSSLLSWGI